MSFHNIKLYSFGTGTTVKDGAHAVAVMGFCYGQS